MRTGPWGFALAAVFSLASPARCAAEWQFVPFLGYTFKGATTLLDFEDAANDTHWNFGGAVTLIGDGPLGVEGYFVRTPSFFQRKTGSLTIVEPNVTSSRTYAFMGNLVLATPRSWNRYGLRPFVSGGLGLLHASHNDRFLPIDLDLLGMNVGGGAVGFVTDDVGVRFDLRYFRNVRGPNENSLDFPVTNLGEPTRLRYLTASIGVVLKY